MLIRQIVVETDHQDQDSENKDTPLKPRDSGFTVDNRVKKLQSILVKLGYDIGAPGIDGKYGPLTARAVSAFKRDYGLGGGTAVGNREIQTMKKVLSGQIDRVKSTQNVTTSKPDRVSTNRTSSEGDTGDIKWASGVDKRVKPEVLARLKQVQNNFDLSLTISSGYRDPKRNKRAGGASRSSHMTGEAVDVRFNGDEQDTIRFIQAASEAGFGGIGVYRPGSVHVDIRNKRAWGPNFRFASLPGWASGAIKQHMGNG